MKFGLCEGTVCGRTDWTSPGDPVASIPWFEYVTVVAKAFPNIAGGGSEGIRPHFYYEGKIMKTACSFRPKI